MGATESHWAPFSRVADPESQRQNRPPHEFPNGSVYEGQWVGPAREGHGVQIWPDGACYTGQWVKDKAQGMGKFVHAAGDWYEGQYLDDMQHGYGVAMYMDGSKYTGNFCCDKHHGDGVEVWPDGKRFQGTYYQGIKHGQGTFRWPDGSSYIGNFEANNLSGIGTYSWADGRSYTGEWEKNTMHGKGTFSYGDGRSYTGDFFEDVKHGHGVFSWPDGRQYDGEWKNGKRHGKGRCTMSNHRSKNAYFQEEGLAMAGVLNLFLLPIIIFEAGWSMNHRAFVDLLFTILTFAVGGTLISMVVVGSLINATCHVHGVCSVRTAFTYAALISAVDPVATLATYAHLQVDPLLNICVFGESVVNDAVAITLFRVLNEGGIFQDTSFQVISTRIASQTSLLLFGSVGLGVLLGFILMFITRMSRLTHSTSNCVLFMFLSSFFIYSFAERACGMSGIITVLFGAMFASAFAKYQFSGEVNMFCAFTLKQAANMADMVVFLMVGITAVYCDVQGLVFGLLVCAFCLVGRAAAVIPLAFLTNLCKEIYRRDLPQEKKLTLDWRKIFMMWHAGLRGGIALVLTLELGPWVDQEQAGTKNTLRNATVLVIVFFLMFFGGSTKVLLKCLDIPMEGTAPPMAIHHGKFWRSMHAVRDRVLKRLLMLSEDEKESSTLPHILADFAEVERRTTSSASLPDAPPVAHGPSVRNPGPSRRGSDLLERGPTERRRQGGQFVSLFGVQDPMHVDDDTSSEEEEEDDSDETC